MKTTNRLMQKSAAYFTAVLAVTLITGCQSARENDAAIAKSPAVAGPVAAPAQSVAPDATTPATASATAVTVIPPVRIKAGVTDNITDSSGNVWLADEGYIEGETYEASDAEISNTKDPALYRSERYSMTGYAFALPNGKYTVKLHFAEIFSGIAGPGERVFSFTVQGQEFKDFDIWVKAGGPNKAYVQSVDVEITNGKLNITFTPNVENPKISAIEILPRS